MTPSSQIHVSIIGATMDEVLANARALGGTTETSTIGNEELLAELRDRFSKLSPPMVVRVEPFSTVVEDATSQTNDNAVKPLTAAEKKAAEKLQKDAAKAATDQALKAAISAATQAAAAASKEPPKEVAAGAQSGAEAGGGDDWSGEAEGPTVDDVKAALNACSAKKGQAATREIMKEKGGSMRLLDVPAEKFADLIEALQAA